MNINDSELVASNPMENSAKSPPHNQGSSKTHQRRSSQKRPIFRLIQRFQTRAPASSSLPRAPGVWPKISLYLTTGWTNPAVYKSAFIELIGTLLLTYLSACILITITNIKTANAPLIIGLSNFVMLTLFIYATANSSGGHLNPTITFATLLTGLSEFSRAVLYVLGQTIGAAIAGGLIRGSFGKDRALLYHGGGCFIDTVAVSTGQAFLIEVLFSFLLTFLAFGIALDPRSAASFGHVIGPLWVGLILGMLSFASSGLIPGYAGAGMNPARCFGTATARGNFHDQWIWWFGPAAGSFLMAFVYHVAPPWHSEPVSRVTNLGGVPARSEVALQVKEDA